MNKNFVYLESDYDTNIRLTTSKNTQAEVLRNNGMVVSLTTILRFWDGNFWQKVIIHGLGYNKQRGTFHFILKYIEEYLQRKQISYERMIRISDNCAWENKSKHLIYHLSKERPTTLVYKIPLHGKSNIDSAHNFPRNLATRKNKYDKCLDVRSLVEVCREEESRERIKRRLRQETGLITKR